MKEIKKILGNISKIIILPIKFAKKSTEVAEENTELQKELDNIISDITRQQNRKRLEQYGVKQIDEILARELEEKSAFSKEDIENIELEIERPQIKVSCLHEPIPEPTQTINTTLDEMIAEEIVKKLNKPYVRTKDGYIYKIIECLYKRKLYVLDGEYKETDSYFVPFKVLNEDIKEIDEMLIGLVHVGDQVCLEGYPEEFEKILYSDKMVSYLKQVYADEEGMGFGYWDSNIGGVITKEGKKYMRNDIAFEKES